MNRQQIAQIYDSFPEFQQNISKGEFIRKVGEALNPNKLAKDLNTELQRRHTGRTNKAVIDGALRNDS